MFKPLIKIPVVTLGHHSFVDSGVKFKYSRAARWNFNSRLKFTYNSLGFHQTLLRSYSSSTNDDNELEHAPLDWVYLLSEISGLCLGLYLGRYVTKRYFDPTRY